MGVSPVAQPRPGLSFQKGPLLMARRTPEQIAEERAKHAERARLRKQAAEAKALAAQQKVIDRAVAKALRAEGARHKAETKRAVREAIKTYKQQAAIRAAIRAAEQKLRDEEKDRLDAEAAAKEARLRHERAKETFAKWSTSKVPSLTGTERTIDASRKRLRLNDSMFPLDKDGRPAPNFAVQETATAFFGRSPDWLRWRYRSDAPLKGEGLSQFPDGYFVLDGEVLEPKVTDKGARYYTLADIEKMAYALVDNQVIDAVQLTCILNIIYANAYLHEIIEEPIIYATR